MQLGISSYTYTWSIGAKGLEPENPMDAFGLLEKAKFHGLRRLQIADNLPLDRISKSDRLLLKKKADESGIQIEVGTRGLLPENLVNYLGIASEFNSPILRVVIDKPGYEPEIGEIINLINAFLPEFERRKIKLAIENHDRLKARQFAEIIEATDEKFVGICLDTVNSIGAGEGFEEVFRILSPFTINFHIKDYDIRRVSHMMGFVIEGKPAGRGMLPVVDIIKELDASGKCESGILELWTPPEDTIHLTIEKEDKWAVESIRFLKSVLTD